MEIKYQFTDYGKVIVKMHEGNNPTSRNIFYIHDIYDKPEDIRPFLEELKMFNFYGVCFVVDQTEEKYYNNQGWTLETFYESIRDVLIGLNLEEIYLMGNGIGASIALRLSQDAKLNFVKLILINPAVSKMSRVTREKIKTIPGNVDETYALMEKIYLPNDRVFLRAKEGVEVLDNTRRFVYNHYIYKKIMYDFCLESNIDTIRMCEKRNTIPTLIISCNADHLFLSSEIESTYRNASDTVSLVEMLDCGHYPWRDNLKEFNDHVMKFLFTGEKLYSENKLPPEYLYQYLADDIKEAFYQKFAKQIDERATKEAARLQKQNDSLCNLSTQIMSAEEVAYYMQYQTETLQASIENAKQYVKAIKEQEQLTNEDFITFEPKQYPSNIIYTTKEGYLAYHDGKGNNYYQLPDSRRWIPSIFNHSDDKEENVSTLDN